MSETKTIVLTVVRHGQTDANKERLVQGEFKINSILLHRGLHPA